MMLGDNITDKDFTKEIKSFEKGSMVLLKKSRTPNVMGWSLLIRYKVLTIEEKPKNPKSNYAIFGLYTFDHRVVEFAKHLTPSDRNEIEIVDLHNIYRQMGELKVNILNEDIFWEDAGTFDSLLRASNEMAKRNPHQY